MIRLLKDVYQ